MADPATLSQQALHQFRLRQRFATRERQAGRMSAEEANARLMPWAAAALRCGADPAAVHVHLAADVEVLGVSAVADDLCPLEDLRAELARARDTALDRHDPATAEATTTANARALIAMAHALHCPPYRPASAERKAA